MANLHLTPIDSPPMENLTEVRYGVNRRWKLAALVLSAISLLLLASVHIVVFRQSKSDISTNGLITTTNLTAAEEKTLMVSSTRLPSTDLDTSFPVMTSERIRTSVGLSLNRILYNNLVAPNGQPGNVTSVTLRLFTNWEGDDPIYIFALIAVSLNYFEIIHRYPVMPARNNTDWQTIAIPLGEFPISIGTFLGVGMQDRSDTNQIYAAQSVTAIYEVNITNMTNRISLKETKTSYGAAFVYTVVENQD